MGAWIIPVPVSIMCIIAVSGCSVEIPLYGNITGYISDKVTSEPISRATASLTLTGDSTLSGTDGFCLLPNIPGGDYHILAEKTAYESITEIFLILIRAHILKWKNRNGIFKCRILLPSLK